MFAVFADNSQNAHGFCTASLTNVDGWVVETSKWKVFDYSKQINFLGSVDKKQTVQKRAKKELLTTSTKKWKQYLDTFSKKIDDF